jgi:hypothetical protein
MITATADYDDDNDSDDDSEDEREDDFPGSTHARRVLLRQV